MDLVRQAMQKNLQGIVLTEHHYLWNREELQRLRREAESGDHFFIFAAQEVETDLGHILVYGVDRTIGEKTELARLRRLFPAAALVWAHPLRGHDPSQEQLLSPHLDAVEIFNINHSPKENYRALDLWHRYRFTAIAGSDAHEGTAAGTFPTQFDHPVKTVEELAGEIRSGRCRPLLKEIPAAGSHVVVTKISLGTKGEDEYRQRLILKRFEAEKKWKRALIISRVVSALHGHGFEGGTFRVPRIIDIDERERVVIEEGQRGALLFDLLKNVNPSVGIRYYRLGARWLACLHDLGLRLGRADRTVRWERKRFQSYLANLRPSPGNRPVRFEKLVEYVSRREEKLFASERDRFIQIHGDYHPKNIIIGQDRMQDISTLFISVIDFDSSLVFDPAFDVGCFLSQFRHQFRHFPEVLEKYREEEFIRTYLKNRQEPEEGIEEKIGLFRIRVNLSIANYLVKVGKGDSADLETVIAESEALLDN